ncbi:unnamed protein product [Cyclocybe aegerita]|uniref:F-box domain-containing protein n=1 Tax=Cyclocybe aegerita TaxID=1973307 RepID=A0A8S0XQ88_CYCAE|nr:unnamed protein product [Cyclocybe aegerita]
MGSISALNGVGICPLGDGFVPLPVPPSSNHDITLRNSIAYTTYASQSAMASVSNINKGIPSNFMNLPMDIHFLICTLASPFSIIALRQTCKTMLYVTRQRVIWINVLQRVCHEKTVYPGTYSPLSNLNLPALEHAALAPYRLEREARTASHREDAVMNLSNKTTYQQQITPGSMASPEKSFLIPGGRFFVTLHHRILELWDLGFRWQRGPDGPIATIHSECHSFTIHPSCDARAIRILTVRYPIAPNEEYSFEVFETYPDQTEPRLAKIASIQAISQYRLYFTSICENLLVLVHEHAIKIWDFVGNRWTSWYTDRTPQQVPFVPSFALELISHPRLQILMTTDQIMLIDIAQRVAVWDIPVLSPDAATFAKAPEPEPSHDHDPLRCIYLPQEYGLWWCNGLSDWYTGSQQPLWFDVVLPSVLPSSHPTFQRFEVTSSHTKESPQALVHLSTFSIGSYQYVLPCRVSGSDLSFVWLDSTHVRWQVGPSLRDKTGYSVSLLNLAIDSDDFLNVSFCPIAGRLCYASSAGNARYIHVIDYLSPPSDAFSN